MEKLLTISVAACNAAPTLGETLSSMCLNAYYMEKLEVIVTDDGSGDDTPQIARGFVEKHPGTFRLISQENNGYGSSLENALARGRGLYFKVVDGDDKVDPRGLESLLDRIQELRNTGGSPDLIVTPFFTWISGRSDCGGVYQKVENHPGLSSVPVSLEAAGLSRGLSIFEITCRRDLLLDAHPDFLHHCLYVDNELVMAVLLSARTLCRLDRPVTVYRTDRPGQSMSQAVLGARFRDIMRVCDRVFYMFTEKEKERSRAGVINASCSEDASRASLTGGRREAAELLVSSMARLAWLAGLLSPHPLRSRSTLRKWERAIKMKSPELFQVTQRSRIARAGRLAGPLGFLVMSASFKIKNRITHPGQVVYFAKKNTSEKE
ncbi:glycosyltransferase family 2 protein [Mobilibacterium timonense]|uniref:glycosyltransferase family 2 protein n=1 Tax=Mobilibacterium timonense TaxID=1871012 RepID=UPI00098423DF|nr:glycosyltransferase family 2 protein [Mobilibacterium timonense]